MQCDVIVIPAQEHRFDFFPATPTYLHACCDCEFGGRSDRMIYEMRPSIEHRRTENINKEPHCWPPMFSRMETLFGDYLIGNLTEVD